MKTIPSTLALLGALFTAGAGYAADPTVGTSSGTIANPLSSPGALNCTSQDVQNVSFALVSTVDGCTGPTDTGSAVVDVTYTLQAQRYDLTLANGLNGLLVGATGGENAQTYMASVLTRGTYTTRVTIDFACTTSNADPYVDVAAVFSWQQGDIANYSLPTPPSAPDINEPKCTTDTFYPIVGLALPSTPALAVVKEGELVDGDADGIDAGDTINYTFTVTNTGTVDLANILVVDEMVTFTGGVDSIAELLIGDDATLTASYTLTADDIARGYVDNTATATAYEEDTFVTEVTSDTSGTAIDNDTATRVGIPTMTVVKTATVNDDDGITGVSAGDTIDYTFTVTNTGGVDLTNIVITDAVVTFTNDVDTIATLAIDASAELTASYTITQDDIDAGFVNNSATAVSDEGAVDTSGTAAGNDTPTSTTLAQSTALTVTKVVDAESSTVSTPPVAGDTVVYDITVENTGNVTITNVDLTDNLTDGTGEVVNPAIVGTVSTTLLPGESDTVSVSYVLTDADILAGKIENLAIATGDTPDDVTLTVESSQFGNADASGAPTPFVMPFLDLVKPDIKRILENDLRQTIQMQSRSFGRMSADALDALKQGQEEDEACGTVDETGALDIANGVGAGNFGREYYDCVRNERRIMQGELSVSKLDVLGTQIAGAFSDRRERFVSEDEIRGWFWGGYLSSTDVTDTATGKVNGIGLNGGIYGASEVSDDAYVDYYLAAAIGRHSFDLNFANLDPAISVTGDYIYAAGFGGLGLSTEFDMGEVTAAPRLAIDLAYAAAGDVKLAGERLGATDNGTLSLAAFEGARLMAELRFSDLDDADAEDADKQKFDIAPRVFCDYGFEEAAATQCGFGISADIETFSSADLTYGVMADYEQTDAYQRATLSLNRTQMFAGGNGAVISTMGTTAEGSMMVGQSVDWKF